MLPDFFVNFHPVKERGLKKLQNVLILLLREWRTPAHLMYLGQRKGRGCDLIRTLFRHQQYMLSDSPPLHRFSCFPSDNFILEPRNKNGGVEIWMGITICRNVLRSLLRRSCPPRHLVSPGCTPRL